MVPGQRDRVCCFLVCIPNLGAAQSCGSIGSSPRRTICRFCPVLGGAAAAVWAVVLRVASG